MAKRREKPTKKTKAKESARCWCKRTAQAKGHGKEIADVKDLIHGIHIESPSFRITTLTHVRPYISDNGARIKGCDPRQITKLKGAVTHPHCERDQEYTECQSHSGRVCDVIFRRNLWNPRSHHRASERRYKGIHRNLWRKLTWNRAIEGHGTYDHDRCPLFFHWPIPSVVGIVFPVILEVVPYFFTLVHRGSEFEHIFDHSFMVGAISFWNITGRNLSRGRFNGICRILSGHNYPIVAGKESILQVCVFYMKTLDRPSGIWRYVFLLKTWFQTTPEICQPSVNYRFDIRTKGDICTPQVSDSLCISIGRWTLLSKYMTT